MDPAIRSDIFGPNPVEADWKGRLTDEAEKQLAADPDYLVKNIDVPDRIRNINEYLTIENIASALEGILGGDRWEKVLGNLGPEVEGIAGQRNPACERGPPGIFAR